MHPIAISANIFILNLESVSIVSCKEYSLENEKFELRKIEYVYKSAWNVIIFNEFDQVKC